MQIFINGVLQGILLGAIGVSFALVYRTTKVFHIAMGGCLALAPYVALAGLGAGLPVWLSVMLATTLIVLVGIVIEELIHWPLVRKSAPSEVHLIASLGVYLIIVQCIAIIWGNETQVLRKGGDSVWVIDDVTLAWTQVLGPVLALITLLALFVWLNRANRGIELRALADNPVLVALLGRNVRALRRWVFGLSGGLVAVAAMAQAWDVGFDPHIGLKAVLLGMVAMIIGGTGSFAGPFLGGILLGVLRAEVVWFGSARWEEAVTFTLLGLFLFFRPQGMFSRKVRLEEGA
ncbi:MAG: branched-chain amino acid ABC transporter permease [Cyclobacteriaceae bacterium]|nr:branched-chain amino acid ABC transporter permease [Cyclobacteriaceae bacterium]